MRNEGQRPANTKKRKTRVSNLAKLDPKHPVPFEGNGNTEAFSFINNVSYLPFLPPKDCFAKLLLEARYASATHNACITTKKDYCAGEGFMDANTPGKFFGSRDPSKELNKEIGEWFKTMNLKNESVVKINRNIFEACFTQGNVPIELVRFTSAGKKKLFVYVHNFLEWRLCKPNEDDIVEEAIQSKLFLKDYNGFVTQEMLKKSRKLPIYNPLRSEKDNWVRDEKGTERTLIWYKNSVTGFPYYGLPSAIAGLIYEYLEYKSARYNLDRFDNEMVAAAILALKGQVGQDEANRIAKNVIDTYTGDGRRGRTIVVASEEGIDGSDYHKMDMETDGSYIQADDKWSQKIILVNQWDAVLAGIVSPSTLGKGAGFITKILENKLNTVIKPAQKDLLDEVWDSIFKIAQAWMGLPFDQYEMVFKNSIDISGLTDVDITEAVQVNEVRKAKGLPEDDAKKGVYMKAPSSTPSPNPQNNGGDNVPA
jgi:hypothetical protein